MIATRHTTTSGRACHLRCVAATMPRRTECQRALMHPGQLTCLEAQNEVDELHPPVAPIRFHTPCGRQLAADCQCGDSG